MTTPTLVRDDMMRAASELVAEYDELPAGSVLRCFARVAREGRLAGVAPQWLPTYATAGARVVLQQRIGQSVPRQRPRRPSSAAS